MYNREKDHFYTDKKTEVSSFEELIEKAIKFKKKLKYDIPPGARIDEDVKIYFIIVTEKDKDNYDYEWFYYVLISENEKKNLSQKEINELINTKIDDFIEIIEKVEI